MWALVTGGFLFGVDFCRILILIHLYKFSLRTGSFVKNLAIAIFLPYSTEFIEDMTLNLVIKDLEEETPGACVSLKSIGGKLGTTKQVDFTQKIDVFYNDYDEYRKKACKNLTDVSEGKIEF